MEIAPFPELHQTGRLDVLFDIFDEVVPEDPFFWAFGAITDIKQLVSLFDLDADRQNDVSDITIWTRVLKIWIHSGRMELIWPQAEVRDMHICVLTGAINPTVQGSRICRFAPGMPFVGLEDPAMETFWDRLGILFTRRQVHHWRKALGKAKGSSGILKNMICLSEPARALWKQGRFALKPLDCPTPTARRLMIEFYWIGLHDNEVPPLFDHRTGQYIKSGHRFTLRTDDPDRLPLPSVELLNMQWALTRVLGFARAFLGDRAAFLLDTNDAEPVEDINDELDPESLDGVYDAEENLDHFEKYVKSIGGPSFDYGMLDEHLYGV